MRRAAVVAAAAAAAWAVAAVPAGASPEPQETVALMEAHRARVAPAVDARQVARIRERRPLAAGRTVLPVLARAADEDGRAWVRVRLPGRILGRRAPPETGWIVSDGTLPSATAWQITVDLATRRVLVRREGVVVRSFAAIVGAAITPTPTGTFFVEESLRLPASRAGAPFALALSARSRVLQEFAGGPGQIALHGRGNIGGSLGTAVSHGCVRLSDAAMAWLAARIAPGTVVTIR